MSRPATAARTAAPEPRRPEVAAPGPKPSVLAQAIRWARWPLTVYLASRLLAFLAIVAIAGLRANTDVSDILAMWDGGWYQRVIESGYPSVVPMVGGEATYSTIGFFPLYPMVARVFVWLLPVSAVGAATITSLLFGAVSTVLLWHLARILTDRSTADRATALFCFFPGSFVLSIAYSEALVLTLSAGCLLALLHRRWLLAGVAAGLATATRPTAIALLGVCLWQSAAAIRARREWRSVIAPLLAPVGFVGFLVFLWARTGEPDAWFRVEEAFGQNFEFGIKTLSALGAFLLAPFHDWQLFVTGVGIVFAIVGFGILLHRHWPAVVTIYTAATLYLGSTRIDSLRPRDILAAFPVFIAVAGGLKGWPYRIVVVTFGCGMVALLALHTIHSPQLGGPPP